MTVEKRLQCFAHGRPGDWQAICVDYDLAVQGDSFEEVTAVLHQAIITYVEDAKAEAPATMRRLLARSAPLSLRLRLAAGYLLHLLSSRGEYRAGFDLPCPA